MIRDFVFQHCDMDYHLGKFTSQVVCANNLQVTISGNIWQRWSNKAPYFSWRNKISWCRWTKEGILLVWLILLQMMILHGKTLKIVCNTSDLGSTQDESTRLFQGKLQVKTARIIKLKFSATWHSFGQVQVWVWINLDNFYAEHFPMQMEIWEKRDWQTAIFNHNGRPCFYIFFMRVKYKKMSCRHLMQQA